MFVVARTILQNESDSEDAVHEVFLKIATKHMGIIKSIESETDIRNYLLKATKNTALNIKKKNNSVSCLDKMNENDIMCSQDVDYNDFVEIICSKCEYERVVKAIQSLGEKYRYTLYYHFVMRLTVSEVSKSLNQSVSATKKQLVRGKQMLLKLLDI